MPTPHRPAPGGSRRPSPSGPPGRSGARHGPPRVRARIERACRWFRPARRSDRDGGAALVELAAVTVLAAAIMVSVYQLELSQTFNSGVRQMVCLVEGPDCGDETWVDADRPEEPEQYEWSGDDPTSTENQSLAMRMAADAGWTDGEWQCLSNLWGTISSWDHTVIDTETGNSGIAGFNPARHGSMPAGYMESPSAQISWGIGYIAAAYDSPCGAFAQWEGSGAY
ncbi:hypothetical protein ACIRPH_04970 [Nocardiopsis sp. NPDC101807]|uniref:aggregation-promoting factor C-terminal-like domain-containing protein n=1 Tax=Nocardiopsis sp. NPDC101807 TaxID=3364339 RepID=UPI00382B38ED